MDAQTVTLISVAIGLPLSLFIAYAAGGSAAWGLLGPIGWLLSAAEGIRNAITATHATPRD